MDEEGWKAEETRSGLASQYFAARGGLAPTLVTRRSGAVILSGYWERNQGTLTS